MSASSGACAIETQTSPTEQVYGAERARVDVAETIGRMILPQVTMADSRCFVRASAGLQRYLCSNLPAASTHREADRPSPMLGMIPQLIRHFLGTEVVGRDLPSPGVPRQRNSIAVDSLTAKKGKMRGPAGPKLAALC